MTLFSFINKPNNKKEDYSVIYSYENFELRKYESIVLAEYTNIDNQEFSVLADFIFGGNEEKIQIPMTAPVITTMEQNRTMSFVMPRSITNDNCPTPNDDNIKLKKVKPRLAAAISFSGYPEDSICASKKEQLIGLLETFHIEYENDFELHVFDPPYKSINRRNEIVVSIKG